MSALSASVSTWFVGTWVVMTISPRSSSIVYVSKPANGCAELPAVTGSDTWKKRVMKPPASSGVSPAMRGLGTNVVLVAASCTTAASFAWRFSWISSPPVANAPGPEIVALSCRSALLDDQIIDEPSDISAKSCVMLA